MTKCELSMRDTPQRLLRHLGVMTMEEVFICGKKILGLAQPKDFASLIQNTPKTKSQVKSQTLELRIRNNSLHCHATYQSWHEKFKL